MIKASWPWVLNFIDKCVSLTITTSTNLHIPPREHGGHFSQERFISCIRGDKRGLEPAACHTIVIESHQYVLDIWGQSALVRYLVVQLISRTCSSSSIDKLCSMMGNFPFPHPLCPWQPLLHSLVLTILRTLYNWDCAVFVLL